MNIHQSTDYILGEGEIDEARLDLQNTLFKDIFVKAFEEANSIKNCDGLTIVDFGCGSSSAYPEIKKFIGETGQYIGIDSSTDQLATSKQKYPHLDYLNGNEKTPEVLKAISSSDIVYMRFVVMHQKQQQNFIQKIYSHLKPGSVLIIQEPEETEERKKEMMALYPNSEILCDIKPKLAEKLGLNYNFAPNIKIILEGFKPEKMVHGVDKWYAPTSDAKQILQKNIESISSKALSMGIYTEAYIEECLEAATNLPSEEGNYWFLVTIHTFVVQK